MKKKLFLAGMAALLCALGLVVSGCASAPVSNNNFAPPGENESLLIFKRKGSFFGMAVKWNIIIDETVQGTLANGGELHIVVPNGRHELSGWIPSGRLGEWTRPITKIEANSETVTYRVFLEGGTDPKTKQPITYVEFEETGRSK